MRCRECGAAARVLETRSRGDACTARRHVCTRNSDHRFWTLEVYDTVAKAIGSPWKKRVKESERGLEMRGDRAAMRYHIELLLDEGKSWAYIVERAGCSRGLVALVARELRRGNSPQVQSA